MAFVDDPLKKPEDEDQQASGGAAGGPISMQSAAVGAPAPGGAPAGQPAPQASPTRWANFSQVFAANQGDAQKTGNALASGIQNQAQGAQQAVGAVQKQFGQAVTAGQPFGPAAPVVNPNDPFNKPTITTAPTAIAAGQRAYYPGQIQGKTDAATATAIGQDPRFAGPPAAISADEARARSNETYSGPKSVADQAGWADATAKANDAQKQVDLARTETGRQALLQQQQKDSTTGYTRGESRLDAALAGQASGPRFSGLQQQFSGLAKQRDQAIADSQAQAGKAEYQTQQQAGRYGKAADQVDAETLAAAKDDPAVKKVIATATSDGTWPPRDEKSLQQVASNAGPLAAVVLLIGHALMNAQDAQIADMKAHPENYPTEGNSTFNGGNSTATIGGKHWDGKK